MSATRLVRKVAAVALGTTLLIGGSVSGASAAGELTPTSAPAAEAVPAASETGSFVSLDPFRLLDTRYNVGAAAALSGGSSLTLSVLNRGGVPASGVSAVILNVTVTGPTQPGHITVYPSGTTAPTASNLNFDPGQTIANLVVAKLGTDGKVALKNGGAGTTHLIADVAGYILTGTPTAPGTYNALDPARLLDTRYNVGAAAALSGGSSLTLSVLNRGGVPASGVSAVILNVTVTGPTQPGHITVYPSGTTAPTASNLNFDPGQTIANLVVAKLGTDGKVALKNGGAGTTHLIADVAGYILTGTPPQPDPVTIGTTSLPAATAGTAYTTTLAATGGTAPYTWTLTSGTLPTGLTLSNAGVLAGTPTTTGTTTLTFTATDTKNATATKTLTLNVNAPAAPVTIGTTSLPAATAGTAYTTTLAATGGTAPYTWTLTSGTLPTGLTLSNAGVLAGTPTTTGTTTLTFTATDTKNATATKTLTLNISGPCGTSYAKVRHVSGTISADTTWARACADVYALDSTVTVASGATLTVEAGVAIKAASRETLAVSGSLVTAGTVTNPVVFTTSTDDTVGGDSNGDGTATTPTSSTWGGISAQVFERFDMAYTEVRHAPVSASVCGGTNVRAPVSIHNSVLTGVNVNAEVVDISNNLVKNAVGSGIAATDCSLPADAPSSITVRDNNVTGTTSAGTDAPSGRAITIRSRALDGAQLTGNRGTNNAGGNVLVLTGALSADTTWPVNPGLTWAIEGDRTYQGLVVPAGVTLTMPAGSIMKGYPAACWWGCVASLDVKGSLVTAGTVTNPVVFTTSTDDTVGGDSNGDGTATTPTSSTWGGISAQVFERFDMAYTEVRHAPVSASVCGGTNVRAPVSIHNSVLTGVNVNAEVVDISNNLVKNAVGSGIAATDCSLPADAPSSITVRDNNVTGTTSAGTDAPSGRAITIRSRALDGAQLTGNRGTNNAGGNVLVLTGALSADTTWPVNPGLTWAIEGDRTYQGLVVPAGVTLTMPAGSIMKTYRSVCMFFCGSVGVEVLGSLITTGTATDPVVFTTSTDDTVGGDSNGDGTATTSSSDYWNGIAVRTGALGSLVGVDIRYAKTALSADPNSAVEIHGSVAKSTVGVVGSDTFLDATFVDWGSASGPAPIGAGVGYSGDGVLVADWKGYVRPAVSATLPPVQVPTDNDCKKIVFIGARGSGEDPQGDPDPSWSGVWSEGLGSRVRPVLNGLQLELEAQNSDAAQSIKVLSVRYRALGVGNNPLRMVSSNDPSYLDSIYDGVNQTITLIKTENNRCRAQGQKIVLSGYSQGALAIHIALRKLQATDPTQLETIAGVALISDPAKTPFGSEDLLEEYNKWAGTGINNAQGIWSMYMAGADDGPLPGGVTSRTISMCRNHDPVCAPPLGPDSLLGRGVFGMRIHTDDYYKTHSDVLGRWVADKYLGVKFIL